jgi:alcohol dehydrogenase
LAYVELALTTKVFRRAVMLTMKEAVLIRQGKIALKEKPIPVVGPGEALIKITTTTICGTDVHILKGEYPVEAGRTIGHEPVGVIEELGAGITGYSVGQRVIVGAITPCGQCHPCLDGHRAQCGGKATGGWRFGNTIDGCQAEYLLAPHAMLNLEPIPDGLTDEQVLMCPDIMSTGFGGAESGEIKIGDTVVIFAQGPIGLCATAGAKLKGASLIIAVDGVSARLEVAKKLGADVTIDYTKTDPLTEIMRLTHEPARWRVEGRDYTLMLDTTCVTQQFTITAWKKAHEH